MADANLTVQISADIDGLAKGLKTADGQLVTFEKSVAKTGEKLSKDLQKGANQAGNALTNLGRVAQDAPFGFIGIQNNLNPLLESFQRLKAETGSTGSALKALGTSLIGPAGLGVAFSAVTALITVLSQHPDLLTNAFSSLTNETTKLTAAQMAYNDSLAESVSGVQGEIANVNSLVSIIKDENLSREARLEAVNQLNKQYPELNNQITIEGIESEKTKKAIDNLNNSLITKAKIQSVQELIGDEFKKQLESQTKSFQSQASTLSKVVAFLQLANPLTGAFAANQTLIASGSEESAAALGKSQKNLSDYQKILNSLNTSLAESGNLFIETPAKIQGATFKAVKGLNELKKLSTDALTAKGGILAPSIDQNSFKQLKELPKDYSLLIAQNDLLKNSFQSTFGSIGETIGQGIVEGSNLFAVLGQTILTGIGDVLVQFGKLTIAAGIAATGLAAALSQPFNPASGALAIAAGIALVAVGSAVKAFSSSPGGNSQGAANPSSIPAFATGVTGFSGGMALVGERGPELVTLGRGSNVVTNENISRFMGNRNQNIILEGNLGISMGQLVFALRREEKLMGRTN